MSNNNNRGNTARNASNAKTTNPPPQNRGPKEVWVIRPSFTVGDCRVYFTKEDAIKDFGRSERLWEQHLTYDIDRNMDREIWTTAKSPVWDAEHDVQWEMEKIEIRASREATIPVVATQPPAPTTKTLIPAETPEEVKSSTVSDEN